MRIQALESSEHHIWGNRTSTKSALPIEIHGSPVQGNEGDGFLKMYMSWLANAEWKQRPTKEQLCWSNPLP